jgi:mono/diheme cytochrome c family protein
MLSVVEMRRALVPGLLACGISSGSGQAADPGLKEIVAPFIENHCVSCHGPEKQKGKLRLDTLSPDFRSPLSAEKWKEVLNAVNGHEMPPEDEPQPEAAEAGRFAEWVEQQLARAEMERRSTRVVLRRMNRAEYDNTIRDLIGIDCQPAEDFPEDPPAGGFDNIGQALTISPMQVELYYAAARKILDLALPEGPRPEGIKWRFEPEENTGGMDRLRVKRGEDNILLNDGENPTEKGFTVVHHRAWNKNIGFRSFHVPVEGDYILRFRAAGRVPSRKQVAEGGGKIVARHRDEETAKNSEGAKYHQEDFAAKMEIFAKHRMYDYGPPRVKITRHLGGAPQVIAEMDVDAPLSAPKEYEVKVHLTPAEGGFEMEYAYDIPSTLENFWMQERDEFPRPELLVDWLELEGPVIGSWPPESSQRLLFDSAAKDQDETAYAREVLARFMPRAYRRPVEAAEIEAKLELFKKVRAEKPSFNEAIKTPLAAVLASPHFLYLVEPESPGAKAKPLNGHELAARLSYFLWSSMPDEALTKLAESGELLKPAELRKQVRRMLGDGRSAAFVTNFAGQWLGLRKVGANPPARTLYPEYDRHLETSIIRESEAFFAEILRHDLDARNFIRSEFVTINERLARHYGIDGVRGDEMRRVAVTPESRRGGLVTQASFHSITSNGTRTSPVLRGTWILKTLLGRDPGLPVANVGEIQPKVPGIDKATVRQRLEIHRQLESCARCHDKIDPLGLALENFNAAGEWRDQEGHGYNGRIEKDDPVIDASAKMPDGTEFSGVAGLQEQLLKSEDLFLAALTRQLSTYALGRELGFSDQNALRSFVSTMKEEDYTLRSLIEAIVCSELFTTK